LVIDFNYNYQLHNYNYNYNYIKNVIVIDYNYKSPLQHRCPQGEKSKPVSGLGAKKEFGWHLDGHSLFLHMNWLVGPLGPTMKHFSVWMGGSWPRAVTI